MRSQVEPGAEGNQRKYPIEITHRINDQIRISPVRLVSEDGKVLGIVPTDEARKMAIEAGLDLVEVAPAVRPPVCRIMDYGKFKHEQTKRQTQGAKLHRPGTTPFRKMVDFTATPDWSSLPAPIDDGLARHLAGMTLPACPLAATDGSLIDLAALRGKTVVYAYPRTGRPGIPNPEGWDLIPGARGCTPKCCAFRDHFDELKALGLNHVFGLSTQDTDYQREAAERLHLPFPLLSDERLELTTALRLPTFAIENMVLLQRLTLIIVDGVVTKVFYPVFPPDQSAAAVVAWLRESN
jgi:peroxiredoxin